MPASALEQRAIRMRRMIQRLNVDILELAYAQLGGVLEEAREACMRCPNVPACLRWLDAAEAGCAPSFCPNLARFSPFSDRADLRTGAPQRHLDTHDGSESRR